MADSVQIEILDGLYKALKKQIDYYSRDELNLSNVPKDERIAILTELGTIHTRLTSFANSDMLLTLNDVEKIKTDYQNLIKNIPSGSAYDDTEVKEKIESLQSSFVSTDSKLDELFSIVNSSTDIYGISSSDLILGYNLKSGVVISQNPFFGGYLSSLGVLSLHSSYNHTSFIAVIPSKKYTINAVFGASAYMCLYDINGQFLSSLSYDTHLSNGKIFTVPENVYYIRCSYLASSGFSISANEDIYYNHALFKPSGLSADTFFKDINYLPYLETNTYLAKNGIKTALSGYSYFKIPVLRGDSFFISGGSALAQRLHNANGVFFPSVDSSKTTVFNDFIDIENDGFLEVSFSTSKPFVFKRSIPNTALIRNIELIPSYSQILLLTNKVFHRKVLCIGDSLTSGSNYILPRNGVSIEECYPYYLNLMSGWEVTNAGYGGITSKGFYDSKLSSYDASNYDAVIIWLGTNGGLTDTIDSDTSSADYLTYAETNTGRYCSIIEKLKNQNPNIKIYLFSIFGANVGLTSIQVNQVIEKIAKLYSHVYYLDICRNNRLYPNIDLHSLNDGGHFNKVGNKRIAEYAFIDILSSIEKNIFEYKDVLYGDRITSIFNN